MEKYPAVYILASKTHGTLYVGVTSNLPGRVWQHKHNLVDGFTKKYSTHRLVYYEAHTEMVAAIIREKQIKCWKRAWKIRMIEKMNPTWRDLWDGLV